uniref:CCHC-type domain-containing protein n=1 Tax=Glossina pallidipes TaxID=7398 RepID=A0A1B0A369_GLOPL
MSCERNPADTLVERTSKDLTEFISLEERFDDIPTMTLDSPLKETSGPSCLLGMNAPATMNTSSNVCLRCAQPGHFARDCDYQTAPFCWDCGGPGVLTKNCCDKIPDNTHKQEVAAGKAGNGAHQETHIFSPFFYPKISQETPNWNLLHRQVKKDGKCSPAYRTRLVSSFLDITKRNSVAWTSYVEKVSTAANPIAQQYDNEMI